MRITELLEGTNFNDIKFVKANGNKREIDFDLAEDLIHFMNNDDDVYRRQTHPAIMRCVDRISLKQPTSHNIFKPAIENSYKLYIKKYPIRELPDTMEEEQCVEACKKMHEAVCGHIKDGKYKD